MKKKLMAILLLVTLSISNLQMWIPNHAFAEEKETLVEISKIFKDDKGLLGAKDAQGNIIVEAVYESFMVSGFGDAYYDVSRSGGANALMDRYGRIIIEARDGYIDGVDFVNETYILTQSTEMNWKESHLYTFDGKNVTPQGYREALSPGNGFVVGMNTPVLSERVKTRIDGVDYDFEAVEKTLITASGSKFDLLHDDDVRVLTSDQDNNVYRNFAYVVSKDKDEKRLIHDALGQLGSYYGFSVIKCSDKAEEQYIFAFYNHEGIYQRDYWYEIELDLYMDVYNSKGELIFDGIEYAVVDKTLNGFKLANKVNAPKDASVFYWADASPVKAVDMDRYENNVRYEGFDNDSNTRQTFGYYPTVAGSKIDFSLDEGLMEILEDALYIPNASAKHNLIWFNKEKNPDTTDALLVFNEDNSVTIKLKAYNDNIRMFLEDSLNYIFDRKVVYEILDRVLHDVESVYIDDHYETQRLDSKPFKVGLFEAVYVDGDGTFDVKLTYDSDLKEKGLAAFQKEINTVKYPLVDVDEASLDGMLHYAVSGRASKDFGKSGIEILTDYLEKEYTLTTLIDERDHADILFYGGRLTYQNKGVPEVVIDFDLGSHTVDFKKYTEDSKAFLVYLMDGLYSKEIAQTAYTQLFSDLDYVIDRFPSYSLTYCIDKMRKGFIDVGPMVMEYKDKFTMAWTYPVYDHNNPALYTVLDQELSLFNLGYTEPVTRAYLFNYFKPYGYVIDGYISYDGHVILTGKNLVYNKESLYGGDNDLVISSHSANTISIHTSNEFLYDSQNIDQLNILHDYFLVAFGQDKGRAIIEVVEAAYKSNEKGFRQALNTVERTIDGIAIKCTVEGNGREVITITYPDVKVDNTKVGFSDVNSSKWYSTDVKRLVDKGAISGYPDGTFGPDKSITVGEFIKTSISTVEDGVFYKDSKGLHWANGMLEYAIEKGIVVKEEFDIDDLDRPINRYEMARILIRISENLIDEQASDTSKVSTIMSDYKTLPEAYKYYVEQAYAKGLLGGVDSLGTYGGQALGNRAEASVMIIRMIDASRRITVDYD